MVPRLGLEPRAPLNSRGRFLNSAHKYAHNGSVLEDAALDKVILAWSRLSPEIRAAVLAIVEASGTGKGGTRD